MDPFFVSSRGRGAGFHTTTEYDELATFVPKAEALVRFLWGRRAEPP